MPRKNIVSTRIKVHEGDRKRIVALGKRMMFNLPKIGRRTVDTVAKKGKEKAKQIVEMKEATFSWQGKGSLRESITIIPGKQSNEQYEVKLAALAPHALVVEEGAKSGLIPRRRRWRSDPRLASWMESLMKATGQQRMPGIITVSATSSSQQRPYAWGTEGMRYMEGAFQFMIPYTTEQLNKLRKEIF